MNIQCENLNKAFDEKILENIIANTAAAKEKENTKNSLKIRLNINFKLILNLV